MRWTALALGLLVFPGCNQIFGLEGTEQAPPIDGPPVAPWRVKLTYQFAQTKTDVSPDPILVYDAIDPAPLIKVGGLDPMDELTPALYLRDLVDNEHDGEIEFPRDFLGKKWRFEYTLPGEPPREVQWTTPEGGTAHLVVPVFGRPTRTIPPPNSGYRIDATTPAHAFQRGRLITTGIWIEAQTLATNPPELSFGPQGISVLPLSGEPGAPDPALADTGVIVDYQLIGNCEISIGAAGFVVPALLANVISPVTAAWANETRFAAMTYVDNGVSLQNRMVTVLGSRKGTAPSTGRSLFGIAPSTAMPAFTHAIATLSGPGPLAGPLMLTLGDCPFPEMAIQHTNPVALASFPKIGVGYIADVRRVDGTAPDLVSGITAVGLATGDSVSLDYRVPFAIAPITLGTMDLAAAADRQNIPDATGLVKLEFAIETGTGFAADYYEVVLYEVINGGAPELIRKRIYVLPDPIQRSVMVDTSQLDKATEYVFSIHGFRGRPAARTNDFQQSAYPQTSTTMFTRTFVKQ